MGCKKQCGKKSCPECCTPGPRGFRGATGPTGPAAPMPPVVSCCDELHVVRVSTNYQIQQCDRVIIVIVAPGQTLPIHLMLPPNPCLGQELTISTEVDVIVDGLV